MEVRYLIAIAIIIIFIYFVFIKKKDKPYLDEILITPEEAVGSLPLVTPDDIKLQQKLQEEIDNVQLMNDQIVEMEMDQEHLLLISGQTDGIVTTEQFRERMSGDASFDERVELSQNLNTSIMTDAEKEVAMTAIGMDEAPIDIQSAWSDDARTAERQEIVDPKTSAINELDLVQQYSEVPMEEKKIIAQGLVKELHDLETKKIVMASTGLKMDKKEIHEEKQRIKRNIKALEVPIKEKVSKKNIRKTRAANKRIKSKSKYGDKSKEELRAEKKAKKEQAKQLKEKAMLITDKTERRTAMLEYRKAKKASKLAGVFERNKIKREEIAAKLAAGLPVPIEVAPEVANEQIAGITDKITGVEHDVTVVEETITKIAQDATMSSADKLILLESVSTISTEFSAVDIIDEQTIAEY